MGPTLLPTSFKYAWNLCSTSLDRLVQLLRICSISSFWPSQFRWKVIWWGIRLLILFRNSRVTVLIPSKELAKSSLHFLDKKTQQNKKTVKGFQIRHRRTDGRTGVPVVDDELLLQQDVLPPEGDDLLVVLVSVPDGDVSLPSNVQNHAGEVRLDEVDHGFLLLVEAQQGLHLACTAEGRGGGVGGQRLRLSPRSRVCRKVRFQDLL